jgi:Skp family chaperone for outer membrane proteins
MKRTVLVLLLSLLLLGVSSSTGQPVREANRPIGATRVAVVNVGAVFHKYHRAIQFKADIDDLLRGPKADSQRILDEMKAWDAALKAQDFTDASKEEYEAKLKNAKKKLDDIDAAMRNAIGKRQEDNLLILWNEVREGVRLYAEQQKLGLVLGYGDPSDKRDLDLFPNVNRKMQAMDLGSTVPLFIGDRVEISEGVIEWLNNSFGKKAKD